MKDGEPINLDEALVVTNESPLRGPARFGFALEEAQTLMLQGVNGLVFRWDREYLGRNQQIRTQFVLITHQTDERIEMSVPKTGDKISFALDPREIEPGSLYIGGEKQVVPFLSAAAKLLDASVPFARIKEQAFITYHQGFSPESFLDPAADEAFLEGVVVEISKTLFINM